MDKDIIIRDCFTEIMELKEEVRQIRTDLLKSKLTVNKLEEEMETPSVSSYSKWIRTAKESNEYPEYINKDIREAQKVSFPETKVKDQPNLFDKVRKISNFLTKTDTSNVIFIAKEDGYETVNREDQIVIEKKLSKQFNVVPQTVKNILHRSMYDRV